MTVPEIIPKFTCLLARGKPVVLHGDGSPTRRYLYAGDAADAFDTILHKGKLGEIYNVGSYDEISNMSLCYKLLAEMDIISPRSPSSPPCNYTTSPPSSSPSVPEQEEFHRWVKYTHDRPFNDHRYAVDGTKLRKLGWEPKTSFEEGLRITVDWYRRFGEKWWGDITHVLTPFPKTAGSGDDVDMDVDEEIEVCDEPVTSVSTRRGKTAISVSSDTWKKETFGLIRSPRYHQHHHQQLQPRQHHHREREHQQNNNTRQILQRDSTNYESSTRIPRSCALQGSQRRRTDRATSTGLASPGITLDEDDGFDDVDDDDDDDDDDDPTISRPTTTDYAEPQSRKRKRKLSTVVRDDIANDISFNQKARGIIA